MEVRVTVRGQEDGALKGNLRLEERVDLQRMFACV